MFLLALDTCDSRGSIALLDDQQILGEVSHPPAEDFSSWLLPAVDRLLSENSVRHSDLRGYAVASGPGSFTGVRVGLTTAKAWAEIYAKPIFPVSRLAILADRSAGDADFAAAFIDAQRRQIFGALFQRSSTGWTLVGDEAVIDPVEFFQFAVERASRAGLSWVSMDPRILTSSSFWNAETRGGVSVIAVEPPLAGAIGRHVLACQKKGTDPLVLDANYVRRSDAEIFGKKAAAQ